MTHNLYYDKARLPLLALMFLVKSIVGERKKATDKVSKSPSEILDPRQVTQYQTQTKKIAL